jgi:APA family basic amino acid/polyamine antiporter
MATALVTGNMIGSGIFLLPASLAHYGGISLVGWTVSAIGAVAIALVFAALSRQVRGSGGPYAYTRAAFGDLPGFLVGWGYWISMIAGNAAIAIAFVGYLVPFAPFLGRTPVAATAAALAAIWLLALVNVAGVRGAGRVQLATTLLKLIPLIAVGLLGVVFLEPGHFEPWNLSGESGLSAVTATAALTFWAFMGMECANIPADEVEDPERTVPRAAIGGTLLAAAVYIPSTIGVMGVIAPAQLSVSTAPYADAAGVLFGSWAYYAVALGAAVACFGALNGWTLCLGQIPLAAARDDLFPAPFGRVSTRGTPAWGIVVSTLLVSVLVLMNYSAGLVEQFTFVILLATLSALLPYLACALARMSLLRRSGDRNFLPAKLTVAAVATAFSVWAIVGTGAEAMAWGSALLATALPVFLLLRRQRDRDLA